MQSTNIQNMPYPPLGKIAYFTKKCWFFNNWTTKDPFDYGKSEWNLLLITKPWTLINVFSEKKIDLFYTNMNGLLLMDKLFANIKDDEDLTKDSDT